MKILSYLYAGLYFIGYTGNLLLFFYTEWKLIVGNWWNLINPFFHLVVIWSLVTNMYFWIFLAFSLTAYLASLGADRLSEKA